MSRTVPAPGTSFCDRIASKLSASALRNLENVFDAREVDLGDWPPGRSGQSSAPLGRLKMLWPMTSPLRSPRSLRASLQTHDLNGYDEPACCAYHSGMKLSSFVDPSYYPEDQEKLAIISELIWAVLPHGRAIQRMVPARKNAIPVSRMMKLDAFLERYDCDVLNRTTDKATQAREYRRRYAPTRHPRLRQGDLMRDHSRRRLQGLIGAYALGEPPARGGRRRLIARITSPSLRCVAALTSSSIEASPRRIS